MKRLFLEVSFSKIYVISMVLISLLVLGTYFSYAMFTVSKERGNAISIVTGNLEYELLVDGEVNNTLTVESNSSKEFIITLNNPNNRMARFNFYYVGSLDEGVSLGYVIDEGYNATPLSVGVNLESSGSAGSSNVYKIIVRNTTNSSKTITLGVSVGLDYNDLSLPSDGHLFNEYEYPTVSEAILAYQGENGSTYNDGTDTFITGTDPNNYIWYSGKLWRAVSVNKSGTTKLVTQWNISVINYSSGSTAFEGSHMEMWLNDTSVDGFLGNLRDYEKFIVTDAKWNATLTSSSSKPAETTMVTDAVGLLNSYEYQTSYSGTTAVNGYLNNGLIWWTLTPYSTTYVHNVSNAGSPSYNSPTGDNGVRPSINLKSNVKIVDGDGTESNPYRLEGDNDNDLSGTLLNTRYSGEYITFGTGENTLYRIVSHETSDLTKVTSAEPLKSGGSFLTSAFGSNDTFSSNNTIGAFLNGNYLTNYAGSTYSDMIADSTTWYLGTVYYGYNYRLAKYTDTSMNRLTSSTASAKVGLLRFGELMAGQFKVGYINNAFTDNTTAFWTLTKNTIDYVRYIYTSSTSYGAIPQTAYGIKPSMNLKSNVVITDGEGTLQKPFKLSVQ